MTIDEIKAQETDEDDYRRVFKRHVFQLLKWGYDRLDASTFQASEEEDITSELVRAINEITQDRSYPHWVGFLSAKTHVLMLMGEGVKDDKKLILNSCVFVMAKGLISFSRQKGFHRGGMRKANTLVQKGWENFFQVIMPAT